MEVVEPDMRFHTSLIDAVGNERTSKMYRSLVSEVRLCMTRVQSLQLLTTALIHAEHQKLLELIEAGEGEGAAGGGVRRRSWPGGGRAVGSGIQLKRSARS